MSPYLRAEGRPEKPWGRGGADGLPRGLGGLRDWGGEPGAEPGSPAVPTRGEQISVAPRAPPPPAPPPSPPPQLFPALTSCLAISKAPARASRSPPATLRRRGREPGSHRPGVGRSPRLPGTPSARHGLPSSPASRSPRQVPPRSSRVCCPAPAAKQLLISLKTWLESQVALRAPHLALNRDATFPPRTGLG